MWVPETTFLDADAMEPVDNVKGVRKARTKLQCGVCRQPHGACIQCAGDRKCFAAYHPLCGRAAGPARYCPLPHRHAL